MKNRAAASFNDLTVVPVRKYKIPKYPTQAEAFSDPELLRKLPPSWVKNATVTAAAGFLGAFALAANAAGSETTQNDAGSNSGNLLKVAPIFEHGSGMGSIGCVMIVPPVFLSEQEALAIIKNAAEDAGISFNDPPPEYIATSNKRPSGLTSLGYGNVGLKLYDAKNGIAAAFIAMRDAEIKTKGGPISVTSYNALELANMAAVDFARQNGDIAVGVFYCPGRPSGPAISINQLANENLPPGKDIKEYYNELLNEYRNERNAYLEKQLRAQVRDFLEWLQAQGIM